MEDRRLAARQPGLGIAADPMKHAGDAAGEIGRAAVGGEADRVRDADPRHDLAQLALEIPVDGAGALALGLFAIVPTQKAPQGWTRASLERVSALSASIGRMQRQLAGRDVAE